jgi:uncharacterized membrane protein
MDTTSQNSKRNPETELKSAAQLYWIYAFFMALPITIIIAISNTKPTASGREFECIFAAFIMLLVLNGVLLFMKIRLGLYLGWLLMPLILVGFPIGTAIGAFIISKLLKADVKALLTK